MFASPTPMRLGTPRLDELLRPDLVDDPDGARSALPHHAAQTARRRLRWGKDASLAAVALGAASGFFALTRLISGHRGTSFDRTVVCALGSTRRPLSNALVRGLTFFGSVAGAGGLALTASIVARHRPRLVSQIAAGALGGVTAELIIKRFFMRARPTLLQHLENVTSTSFPSGHATAAASIYLTLAFVASRSQRLREHRAALLIGASGFASMVGMSRVYLGVHWPTDVLGGLAIGTAWACTAEAFYDLTGAERVQRDCAEPHALAVAG